MSPKRPKQIRTSVLVWVCNNNHLRPGAGQYLSTDDAVIGDQRVSRAELQPAIAVLESKGLITTAEQSHGASSLPQIVQITGAGRECVEDFDGDIDLWEQHVQGNHGVSIQGKNVNINASELHGSHTEVAPPVPAKATVWQRVIQPFIGAAASLASLAGGLGKFFH